MDNHSPFESAAHHPRHQLLLEEYEHDKRDNCDDDYIGKKQVILAAELADIAVSQQSSII